MAPPGESRPLLVLLSTQLAGGLSMGLVAPILGLYFRSRGLTLAQIGFIGSASMLGWFIWEPVVGLYADRLGKTRILSLSLAATGLLWLAYPLRGGFPYYALLELVRTSLLSAYSIPVKALTAELLPLDGRGRAYGRFMAVVSLGGVVSPLVGGAAYQSLGPQPAFSLAALLGLAGSALALRLPNPPPNPHVETPWREALSRPLLTIYAIRGLYFTNAGFASSFLPIFLHETPRLQASETQVGAFLTLMRLAGAASRPWAGQACDKKPKGLMVGLGLTGLAASYLGLMGLGAYALYPLAALQGVAMSIADTSMMLHLISITPSHASSLVMGLYSEAENVGGLLSTPVHGYLYQSWGPWAPMGALVAALLLDATLSLWALGWKSEKPVPAGGGLVGH